MNSKTKAVKIITTLAIIVIFISIIVLSCQLVKISNLKKKEKALAIEKDYLISQIYDYNTSSAYITGNYDEYLENYAREVLGWIKKGDKWYTKQ